MPGEAATIETSPISTSLTAGGRRRSPQKLDALPAEFDIRSEKFKQMKKAVAIEAGIAVKFQLEQQLLDEEAKLPDLGDELDKIESALQSSDLCKYTVIWQMEIRISPLRKQGK